MDRTGIMTVFQRYAIYWTPEPGSDFEAFGLRWLGPGRDTFGLPGELAARAIEAPARYGLHATLKAPFRLKDGLAAQDLQQALDAFCRVRRSPAGGPLRLAQFQRYLGLVLSDQTTEADWLAAECVTHFDHFRAPLNESDRDRRSLGKLTSEEQQLFETLGYPYVLNAFQYHISLAGPLSAPELKEVSAALDPELRPFMKSPMQIRSLSLLGEPADGGTFEMISRHPFRWHARF